MVAEVDPLEAYEKRKSNESKTEGDNSIPMLRSGDCRAIKSEQSTMNIVENDLKRTSPQSTSIPLTHSIVEAPVLVKGTAEIVPKDHLNSHDPLFNFIQTDVALSTNSTPSATAILQRNEQEAADTSNGGDADTVHKPNRLQGSNELSPSSKPAIVNVPKKLPGAIVQPMDMSSTNEMPALTVGIGLQASKRVSFTGTKPPHSIVHDKLKHQSTLAPNGVDDESQSTQIPQMNSPTAGKETLTTSTASRPDEAGESSAPSVRSEMLGPTDEIQKARLPLVSLYGTVIHPTDTSLNDARKRLRKALDQTRILRAAFTDRVYEKYKVILRPVPDCVDTVIAKISADPIVRKSQLMEEIRAIKEEKELEKKEAQTLATAGIFNGITGEGKHPPASQVSNAETADQLAYIGAGLNLVILPEEDMQGTGIELGKYEYRGPINAETGQRVGGISAAAATAAEAILDRVRRASILRCERQRRQQHGPDADGSIDPSSSNNTILSKYQLLSSTTTTSAATPKVSDQTNARVAPKQFKKAAQSKSVVSSTASSKAGRSLSQPVISVESILSMNPLAEDLDANRRPSAATSALLARGVGSKSMQQRWRHPHPESLAARKPPSNLSSRSAEASRQGTGAEVRSGKSGLDLKWPTNAADRREKKSIKFDDTTILTSDRAKKVLESILSQFVSPDDGKLSESERNNGERGIVASCALSQVAGSKRNRRATEIGLLHGMQHSADGEGNITGSTVIRTPDVASLQSLVSASTRVIAEQSDQDAIEPIVAFSVLQALGLIHDTPSSHREQSGPVWQRLLQASAVVDSPERIGPSSRFLTLHRKVTSKKRSFSEAFSSVSASVGRLLQPRSVAATTLIPMVASDENRDASNDSNGNHPEQVTATSEVEVVGMASDDSPVVSIRGGGGGDGGDGGDEYPSHFAVDNGGDMKVEALKRPGSAPSKSSSRPSSSSSAAGRVAQSMRPSSSDGLFSTLAQTRINAHGSSGAAFSPQRNAGFELAAATAAHQGVVNQLHAQAHAHQLQLQAAALNRLTPGGDLANFFGTTLHQRQGFPSHADWAALGNATQASAGLLPSRSSLAALGLSHHHAQAMLELSARDNATRAMLAREQQASAVHAAAARQVSAMRGGGSMSGLSSQQAAALISARASQTGAGLFSTSSSSRFGQLGGHSAASAAAILSSPAAAAMIGQSQLSVGAMSGHLALSQHVDSRPSSQHSISSTKSTRGKSSSSKNRKESIEDTVQVESTDLSMSGKSQNVEKGRHSGSKRKVSELAPSTQTSDQGTDSVHDEKMAAHEPSDENNISIAQQSGADSPPRKKLPSTATRTESPKQDSTITSSKHAPFVTACNGDECASAIPDDVPSPQATGGMQFSAPPVPPSLDPQVAACTLDGRIHVAISNLFLPSGQLCAVSKASVFLEYIQAVASAVPIPKALVSNPLKERLNIQSLKLSSNGGHTPSIPREVVTAIVLVWLWVQHKDSFQRAFAKSGRIDVDPECKWLIQAAVDAASRALVSELAEALQNGGLLASALSSARNKGGSGSVKQTGIELDRHAAASITVDARIASIVSEALMTELCIDEEVDTILPIYEDAVQLLDGMRELALKAKCRERVLLAAVVAQRATMSETFADAYVSSLVRGGEALGHGELFEMVQEEITSTSTMMPYDIFSDETRAWEDPCRPANGFTSNLSGEDLVRRAHARAMIIKSLKKMQDRNRIKGGTSDSGPYAERPHLQGQTLLEAKAVQRTQSGSLKRRTSVSLPEQPARVWTGAGQTNSVHQYNPQHVSTPLFWDTTSIENMPYGQHSHSYRPCALSLSSPELMKGEAADNDQRARSASSTITSSQQGLQGDATSSGTSLRRSTEEVDWADVAKAFVTVDLAEGSIPSRRRASKATSPGHQQARNRLSTTIFAPFCNRVDDSVIVNGEIDSGEEDLRDETILRRHQVVLDSMKERLDKFMEGRTTAGQRARQRAQARAADK